MASNLNTKINSYALERGVEFSEAYTLTPTRTGTASTTTCVLNGTFAYNVNGPKGGAGSWLAAGTTSRFDLGIDGNYIGDGDYTIGVWFMLPTLQTGTGAFTILDIGPDAAAGNPGFYLAYGGSTHSTAPSKLGVVLGASPSTTAFNITHSTALVAGQWYYAAVRRQTTSVELFLNGTSVGSTTTTFTSTAQTRTRIGSNSVAAIAHYSNYHAAPSSVLTSTEIAEIWTVGNTNAWQTQVASLSPKLWFRLDDEATTITNNGSWSIIGATTKQGAAAGATAGTGGISKKYFNFPNGNNVTTGRTYFRTYPSDASNSANLFGSAYSFEFWIRQNGPISGNSTTFTALAASSANASGWFTIGIDGPSGTNPGKISYRHSGAANILNLVSTTSVVDNQWHHVVVTRDAAPSLTGTAKLYIDGSLEATSTTLAGAYSNVVATDQYGPIYIGADAANTSTASFLGDLDEVVFYPTELTSTQINANRTAGSPAVSITISSPGVALADPANLVMPTISTTSIIDLSYSASPQTASGLLVDPTIVTVGDANYSSGNLIASALFVFPSTDAQRYVNAAAAVTTASETMPMPTISTQKYVSYSHSAMTVSSTFANPVISITSQANINISASAMTISGLAVMPNVGVGEDNTSSPMTASALLVHPLIVFSAVIAAPVNNTCAAEMRDPAITTELKGQIKASPMIARNALLQTPPAYVNIFNDPWYKTMYDYLVPRTAFSQGKMLKVFEDVTTNKTSGTLNSNISLTMYNNGIVSDTNPHTMPIFADYGTVDNPSLIEIGYFDEYNRKAVKIKNTAFTYYGGYGSDRNDFSMQFSIRTSKADQTLASGIYSSQYSASRWQSTYNLVDGKLNVLTYPAYTTYHPKNISPEWASYAEDQVTGNKRIDDDKWHYVTIQYGQGRLQYWIDGELDYQRFDVYLHHPRNFGANVPDLRYAPDFQTSAVFVNCHVLYSQQDLLLQHFDYQRYKPVKPVPSFASATMGQGTTAKGNRKRALMLYFWTNGPGILAQSNANRGFDSGVGGEFDVITFDPVLSTMDYANYPPQRYYGWDVFPVDINGYYVSDLVKEQAYGGAKNIRISQLPYSISGMEQGPKDYFKTNRRGYFRDQKTDIRRYIDLIKDIDLSQFDSIFFANYPDQSRELDAFAKNEVVDDYFAIRETVIFNDFLQSLRKAVDTGISLYVTNHQLAIDLGIVDRVEVVSDLKDEGYYYQDPYSPTIAPLDAVTLPKGGPGNGAGWKDWVRNNRTRVVNILPGLTDIPTIIKKDHIHWQNDDVLDFGGPSHSFTSYDIKSSGLSVGDEFMMSTAQDSARNYLAAPFSAVKAGTIITAFATHQRKVLDLVENPYANYAQSIALQPGDVLAGKQLGGKIFVNFTEELVRSGDWGQAELIQDKWINLAYANGAITLAQRDAYLNASYNLDRQRERGQISQSQYDRDAYWSYNGMHILAQVNKFESTFVVDQMSAAQTQALQKTATGVEASTSGTQVYQKQLWFTFRYSHQYPLVQLVVHSMLTRGFIWLSNRVEASPEVQRPVAFESTARMIDPALSGDKTIVVNVAAMAASARITEGLGYAPTDGGYNPLPMTAFADITKKVTKIEAAPMIATARLRENVAVLVSSIDEIILYVMHEDPILYLREDIIK